MPDQIRFIIQCFILLLIGVFLAGCREVAAAPLLHDSSAQAGLTKGEPTATLTPFQALRPTFTPTHTLTPSPTLTPTTTPTATDLPCITKAGSIEEFEIAFTDGANPLRFRVYTPPCFERDRPMRYPVLYMIHGQTYNDDQWPRLGIDRAADALIQSEQAPPFLIVMPREENTFADIYLSSFSRDMLEGLLPWVDEHYPTCAERTCRAVGGLSRGGAWALHLGFSRWDLFGAIGLHSTPPFNTDPGRFPAWVQAIPADQMPRVYMDAGRRDPYLSMASSFEEQLVRYGVPHDWYIFNGAHEEEYWSAHVSDYLLWYAMGWEK
jgi:enterochelin esterase-like enzyme